MRWWAAGRCWDAVVGRGMDGRRGGCPGGVPRVGRWRIGGRTVGEQQLGGAVGQCVDAHAGSAVCEPDRGKPVGVGHQSLPCAGEVCRWAYGGHRQSW
jgi:hypothetical protein